MPTWLWTSQRGHRTSQALPVSRPPYNVSLSATLSPALTCAQGGDFPQASHCGHCSSACVPLRASGLDFLFAPQPAIHSPPSLEAFSNCPGMTGHLWTGHRREILSHAVDWNHTSPMVCTISLGRAPSTPYELVYPQILFFSPGYALEFSLHIYGYSPIVTNTSLY